MGESGDGHDGSMPIPAAVARFNRVVTNRITGRFAGHLPGFAIVHHVGRRSGREYTTPVNVFRHGTEYVVALTYGPDRDWVRNVRAAGGCELEISGRRIRVADPRIVHDAERRLMPIGVRQFLGLIDVHDFLTLRPVTG